MPSDGSAQQIRTMSKKQIAILIIAVAVTVAAASVGTAYVVVTGNSELALDGAGDEFTASARIDGLLPGQSSTSEYKAHAPADAVFTILLSGGAGDDLGRYLDVTVSVNGNALYSGNYLSCRGVIFTADVSGDFTFSITYSLPQSVGNSAQGKECSVTARCTLHEKTSG